MRRAGRRGGGGVGGERERARPRFLLSLSLPSLAHLAESAMPERAGRAGVAQGGQGGAEAVVKGGGRHHRARRTLSPLF